MDKKDKTKDKLSDFINEKFYQQYSPKVLAERIRKMAPPREGRKEDPMLELNRKINKINETLLKFKPPILPEQEALNKIRKKLNPLELSDNPFAFPQFRQPAPVGSNREPVIGMGLKTFMKKHNLKNVVDIAKIFKKNGGLGLHIYDFQNLEYYCKAMNVTPFDAFRYICEGMTKTQKRWRYHRVDMEAMRGSLAVVELIQIFKSRILEHKKKSLPTYTQKDLYKSKEYSDFCLAHGVKKQSYKAFNKWWNKINKILSSEAKKRPKGLLS